MSINLADLGVDTTTPLKKTAPSRPHGMAAWKTTTKRIRAKTILYVTSPLLDDDTIRDALLRGYGESLPVHVALSTESWPATCPSTANTWRAAY